MLERSRKMAKQEAEQKDLFIPSCSLAMATLFAYSSSVQLNDRDWYLWLPFYALASAANLLISIGHTSRPLRRTTQLLFWCGVLLFLKVLLEDHVHGLAGFWSLDMAERVVREQLGSGLVSVSMFLQLQASVESGKEGGKNRGRRLVRTCAYYGMAMLVVASIGLTFWFFRFVEMKI